MDDLIEALGIFRKYLSDTNGRCPTNCGHDVMCIMGVAPADVSAKDKAKLEDLGFIWEDNEIDEGCFMSFRFGSA